MFECMLFSYPRWSLTLNPISSKSCDREKSRFEKSYSFFSLSLLSSASVHSQNYARRVCLSIKMESHGECMRADKKRLSEYDLQSHWMATEQQCAALKPRLNRTRNYDITYILYARVRLFIQEKERSQMEYFANYASKKKSRRVSTFIVK